jgi:Ca2+-binding RTX toxin-like protein
MTTTKQAWRRGCASVAVAAGFALTPAVADAAVVFDGSPGTGAPPATLGGYTMTAFPDDTRPEFDPVTTVPGPTGDLVFGAPHNHRDVGSSWATWSHGYSGDVYYNDGALSSEMTLPAGTDAFYLYVEPQQFGTFNIRATAQDGTTSGPVPVEGSSGAQYFGFYGTGGDKIVKIVVDGDDPTGFAVGEFGISAAAPPPADLCFGQPATITGNGVVTGTEGDDVIITGNGNDTVDGKGGNDRICTRGGDDFVRGGAGNDRINSGNGNDNAGGQSGNDIVQSTGGNDDVQGGDGMDHVTGGEGNDTLNGGNDVDAVEGEGGNDLVAGNAGSPDYCDGGTGTDATPANGGCETIVGIP